MLKEDARARGFNLVMFGHTHRPYLEQDKDITILNPGVFLIPDRREENRVIFLWTLIGREKLTLQSTMWSESENP